MRTFDSQDTGTDPGEAAGNDAGTSRWVSYDELAKVRGIERIGAVRLVQRKRWRRQKGNDGHARVLVPLDELVKVRGTYAGTDRGSLAYEDAPDGASDDAGNGAGNGAREDAGTIAAFHRAMTVLAKATGSELATLKAQLAETQGRCTKAETALADERSRLDQARTQLDAERGRADALRDRLDAAEQREQQWWRQSRLRRAWAALSG